MNVLCIPDKIKKPLLRAVSFEKRGLKNIYEKLCLKYTKILYRFNIESMNNSKESINSSKKSMYTGPNIL